MPAEGGSAPVPLPRATGPGTGTPGPAEPEVGEGVSRTGVPAVYDQPARQDYAGRVRQAIQPLPEPQQPQKLVDAITPQGQQYPTQLNLQQYLDDVIPRYLARGDVEGASQVLVTVGRAIHQGITNGFTRVITAAQAGNWEGAAKLATDTYNKYIKMAGDRAEFRPAPDGKSLLMIRFDEKTGKQLDKTPYKLDVDALLSMGLSATDMGKFADHMQKKEEHKERVRHAKVTEGIAAGHLGVARSADARAAARDKRETEEWEANKELRRRRAEVEGLKLTEEERRLRDPLSSQAYDETTRAAIQKGRLEAAAAADKLRQMERDGVADEQLRDQQRKANLAMAQLQVEEANAKRDILAKESASEEERRKAVRAAEIAAARLRLLQSEHAIQTLPQEQNLSAAELEAKLEAARLGVRQSRELIARLENEAPAEAERRMAERRLATEKAKQEYESLKKHGGDVAAIQAAELAVRKAQAEFNIEKLKIDKENLEADKSMSQQTRQARLTQLNLQIAKGEAELKELAEGAGVRQLTKEVLLADLNERLKLHAVKAADATSRKNGIGPIVFTEPERKRIEAGIEAHLEKWRAEEKTNRRVFNEAHADAAGGIAMHLLHVNPRMTPDQAMRHARQILSGDRNNALSIKGSGGGEGWSEAYFKGTPGATFAIPSSLVDALKRMQAPAGGGAGTPAPAGGRTGGVGAPPGNAAGAGAPGAVTPVTPAPTPGSPQSEQDAQRQIEAGRRFEEMRRHAADSEAQQRRFGTPPSEITKGPGGPVIGAPLRVEPPKDIQQENQRATERARAEIRGYNFAPLETLRNARERDLWVKGAAASIANRAGIPADEAYSMLVGYLNQRSLPGPVRRPGRQEAPRSEPPSGR